MKIQQPVMHPDGLIMGTFTAFSELFTISFLSLQNLQSFSYIPTFLFTIYLCAEQFWTHQYLIIQLNHKKDTRTVRRAQHLFKHTHCLPQSMKTANANSFPLLKTCCSAGNVMHSIKIRGCEVLCTRPASQQHLTSPIDAAANPHLLPLTSQFARVMVHAVASASC